MLELDPLIDRFPKLNLVLERRLPGLSFLVKVLFAGVEVPDLFDKSVALRLETDGDVAGLIDGELDELREVSPAVTGRGFSEFSADSNVVSFLTSSSEVSGPKYFSLAF